MHGTGLSFNLLFYFVFSLLYFFVVSCKIKSDVRRKSSFDTFLINSLNSTKHIFFTLSIHFFTSINCFTRILPTFCRNKNAFDAKPDKKVPCMYLAIQNKSWNCIHIPRCLSKTHIFAASSLIKILQQDG